MLESIVSAIIIILGAIYLLSKIKKQTFEKTELQKQLASSVENYKKLLSQKKSSEVTIGLVSEQLAPFLQGFKYNPQRCRFIGEPLDYIYFGDDEIVFIEVKSQKSKLATKQRQLKTLIDTGKVRFETLRINGADVKKQGETNL